jgi:O-antigen ligase
LLTSAVLVLFVINYFYDLSDVLYIAIIAAALIVSAVGLIRHKKQMLFFTAVMVPVSVPLVFGGSKISIPTELLCAALSCFFFLKLLRGYRLSKDFLKHPVTIFILLDLSWFFITACTSELPEVSFKRLVIRAIYYITYYYFFYELFKSDKKYISRVFLFYCIGFLLPIGVAVYKHAFLGFTSMGAQLAAAPFYNDHTMYGAALVFFIPFLFYEMFETKGLKKKSLYSLLFLIFIGAAFLSYSRGAWLSVLIAAVTGTLLRYRISLKQVFIILLLALGFLIYNSEKIYNMLSPSKEVSHSSKVTTHFKSISNVNTDASNKERINRWKCALRMFQDKPFFGFGPGTYQFFYGNYQIRTEMTTISTYSGLKGHAHSEYLNCLSETGFPGLLIFIVLIVMICATAIRLIRKGDPLVRNTAMFVFMGLITFFVHAFFNGFIEFDKLAMPVFISYAALVSLDTPANFPQSS